MNFLETDFKRRRVPKRSVAFTDKAGNLTAFKLEKYPTFLRKITTLIGDDKADYSIVVSRGTYTSNLSSNLAEVVTKSALKNLETNREHINTEIETLTIELFTKYEHDQEIFFQESFATINDVLFKAFIYDSVKALDGSIQRQKDNDDEDASEISEAISSYLTSFFEYDLNEALADFVVNKNIEKLTEVVNQLLQPANVELRLKSYFKTLSITDMHTDVASLNRNKKLKEELELYLYFGQIKASNRTYPLFFVPLTISEQSTENRTSYKLSFEKRFYINKNAIEYVFQEDAQSNTAAQISNQIGDRIVYIDEDQTLGSELSKKAGDLLSNFGIDGDVDFTTGINKSGSSSSVTINNKLSLALFDKADESSINDYEELINILDEDNPLAEMFKNLIGGFIEQEPASIIQEVHSEWDETPTEDRLVFSSPIPLNEEQRKIISAVNNKAGRFITVQGPPGTGKSHTITAILFEAILKDKSVLMLSDKKEALDVVEDKLSEVLNKTRMGESFQNPILRLGREGNTYNKILANQNVENIRTHLRASEYALKESNPEAAKKDLTNRTKEYISKYSEIDITKIKTYLEYKALHDLSDQDEDSYKEHLGKLQKYQKSIERLSKLKTNQGIVSVASDSEIKNLGNLLIRLKTLAITEPILKKYGSFSYLNSVNPNKTFFKEKINQYGEVNSRFFSFLLGKFQLGSWNAEINSKLDLKEYTDFRSEEGYEKFCAIYDLTVQLEKAITKQEDAPEKLSEYAFKQIIDEPLNIPAKDIREFIGIVANIREANDEEWLQQSPFSLDIEINKNIFESDLSLIFEKVSELYNFAKLITDLDSAFKEVPDLNVAEEVKVVQDNSSVEMVNIFDKRFLNFCDNNRTKAQTLKKMISKKQAFPRAELEQLRNAFPCIIAGIRDYADYVPLEPEIFDLIVIDEASQVSIAQAFPAILRAKKVIVLGDKRQFSNVKSANSSRLINSSYQDDIREAFKATYGDDPQKLERSKAFNVRVSILEFFENITNYDCVLRKHFRGYPEIISFSSKNFYNNDLQAIKVRAKPIEEVLDFQFLAHDGKQETNGNTNQIESNFIVSEIEKLCGLENPPSVGVITPMRDQQKFIFSELEKSTKYQSMEKLDLKVMTFDSCQGEERDIIFYSFVDHPVIDSPDKDISKTVLGTKFDLAIQDPEENLRLQRLNVGMSRAKEKIIFVLSKSLKDYKGNAQRILNHYWSEVEHANKTPEISELDSPMEIKLLNWIKDSTFYKENVEKLEIQAQFKAGEYLKALDPTYSHPNYRTDFLMTYRDGDEVKNLIIEYDGFVEHFIDRDKVNEFNYSHYYSEGDIEREKILEGYGFPFMRFNKFNLGKDPVRDISKKLNSFFL
ncbi:AAA domain-containing protein [Gammaproteobacteria bacterium]|nr:AAA domain-containing protein [Gammaproteobacteria bacterium]